MGKGKVEHLSRHNPAFGLKQKFLPNRRVHLDGVGENLLSFAVAVTIGVIEEIGANFHRRLYEGFRRLFIYLVDSHATDGYRRHKQFRFA
jgi:hypothetical protein